MPLAQIRVIVRAVKILDCFVGAERSLGISELARRSHLSKSTAHHVVSTLVETDLLAVDGPTRRYKLGPKLAQLANAFIESTDLREGLMESLVQLRDLTNETATLHVKVGRERVIVAQVVSQETIRQVLEVGLSRPIYIGAAGIVLMGDLSDTEVVQYVRASRPRKLTRKTVTDPQQVLALVRAGRRDGFCILGEQTELGVGAVAVPVRDSGGVIVAAVLISGPVERWNAKTIPAYTKRIVGIVEAASSRPGTGAVLRRRTAQN